MFSMYLLLLLLIGPVAGSHYRGGSMSYFILENSGNISTNSGDILVYITQRHSWRRSAWFCNNTDPNSGNMIGEGVLTASPNTSRYLSAIPSINTTVRCTDYNEEFDYSSGESSTTVLLPFNKQIEYIYGGCCWISVLSNDPASNWALKFIINTKRRSDGTWNSSPKTAMNPIVEVQVGKTHVIRIPMADSDGDTIRCRWGNSIEECGSICAAKGILRSNPCELTYNATQIGYDAVAIIIEDFDSNNNVLSAIPLQFLIHIVNITTIGNCTESPIYIGELSQDSCIGVQSNTTFTTRLQIFLPCQDQRITLKDILTVSPAGLIKGNIARDQFNQSLYTIPIEWTPQSNQYGIHQFCLTPVDSEQRTGSQVCLTFQVDILPPELVRITPTGLVSASQSTWTIETDRAILRPNRSHGIYIRFFKRSNNEEVYRIDMVTARNVSYRPRQITFSTTGYTWQQGEEYYILLDRGIAVLDESCGIESNPINNSNFWVFQVAITETTVSEATTVTETTVSEATTVTTEFLRITTEQSSSTQQITSSPSPRCPRWFRFNRVSNESTNANEPYFIFCFTVEATIADVTIAANTWTPCMTWKLSGTADPLLELYTEPGDVLLAQNDDGNSLAFQNCYAAVLSYRLQKGDYRVIIRNPKCAYGRFELRLSAEIERNVK